ncbi:hypothetical protein C0992_012974 [Termitomyces sp. T32_za158]|nr:hypothetical protein C0992_012974 [Termitomyces sp. T32_za158]
MEERPDQDSYDGGICESKQVPAVEPREHVWATPREICSKLTHAGQKSGASTKTGEPRMTTRKPAGDNEANDEGRGKQEEVVEESDEEDGVVNQGTRKGKNGRNKREKRRERRGEDALIDEQQTVTRIGR